MKKLVILFFLLVSFLGNTQGNLQFNKVLTIGPGESYTVPQGKVLKIESINISSTYVCIPKTSEVSKNCGYYNGGNVTYGIYNGINYLSIANQIFSTPNFSGENLNANQCGAVFNDSCKPYDFGSLKFNCPIWLDAGKTIQVHAGVTSLLISSIEFNIIP